jgi:hypothetical protein
MLDNVNETRMVTSERVHVGEIAVIWTALGVRAFRDISPDRLPCVERVDISAATPISAFQGRNHGD